MLTVPQRVRRTLEDLGPTYIKLGQILSTRPDLLPPQYIIELAKLLDDAAPVSVDEIKPVVEKELGAPIAVLFASFSEVPMASASIGQVHEAVLPDGTPVVVKVQRPGIQQMVHADLNLLRSQARFLEARSETLRQYGLSELLDEFAQALLDELDYVAEGRNVDMLGDILKREGVVSPDVYWELTTGRVITLSRLDGVKLGDTDVLKARGYDLKAIADRIVRLYLTLVFRDGVFHADPHPANIMVCGDKIGLIDFGVIGYLTPHTKEMIGNLLLALVQQDADEMVYIIIRMGATDRTVHREALRRDLQRLVVRYYSASLQSVQVAQFLGDLMAVSYRHRVRMPSDLALLARTVLVLDGVALALDPTLVLSEYLEPFVIDIMKERFSLKSAALEGANTLREVSSVMSVLPRRMDVITSQLQDGDMTVGIDVRRLDQAVRKLDTIGNRLSFSVVVASIVIGSALVLSAGQPAIFRLPFINVSLPIAQIGFVMAGLLGAWLLFSIIRSKGL